MTFLKNFVKEEAGQDMVEYSLLLGFIAMAGVAVYSTVSGSITSIWNVTDGQMSAAATAAS